VGSTYGRTGITVAARIGFDDNRVLGDKEGGGRPAPRSSARSCSGSTATSWCGRCLSSPRAIEEGIEEYLAMQAALETSREEPPRPAFDDGLIAPPPAAPPVTVSDALRHPSP
jgi:hypothetical protein